MSNPAVAVLGVLDSILDALTDPTSGCALTPLPCRVGVAPGATVAWDSCEAGACPDGRNGQLWANLTGFTVTGDRSCSTITWTAVVGIVRCVATVDDNGNPPTVDALTTDANQQAADADRVRDILECCPTRPDGVRDVTAVSWTPLGPSGGCAGGQWTVRGVLDVCC